MLNTYRLSAPAVERDTNTILACSLMFQIVVMLIPLFFILFTGQLSDPRILFAILAFWGLLMGSSSGA